MGCGEEIGGFLRARRGLGGLRHADVDLGCREKRRAGIIDEKLPACRILEGLSLRT